eukprot:766549_1
MSKFELISLLVIIFNIIDCGSNGNAAASNGKLTNNEETNDQKDAQTIDKNTEYIIGACTLVGICLICICCAVFIYKLKKKHKRHDVVVNLSDDESTIIIDEVEIPVIDEIDGINYETHTIYETDDSVA